MHNNEETINLIEGSEANEIADTQAKGKYDSTEDTIMQQVETRGKGIDLCTLEGLIPTVQDQPSNPPVHVNTDNVSPLPCVPPGDVIVEVYGGEGVVKRTMLTCRKGNQGVGFCLMFLMRTLTMTTGLTLEPLLPLLHKNQNQQQSSSQ